jgi:hypothetical protein
MDQAAIGSIPESEINQPTVGDTYHVTMTEYLADNLEAQHWTCLPISKLERAIRVGDLVDARWAKSGSGWRFMGSVRKTKRGLVVKPNGVVDGFPIEEVEILGVVLHYQQVFRV